MPTTSGALSAAGLKQGNFEVDANGQAVYRLPIAIPPGIAGHQPTLELVYMHQLPNGPLGIGWDISGSGSITRAKPVYAIDGFSAPITYGTTDRFALNNQRLINVDGEYGAGNTLYYTELQTWNYVQAGATPEDGFTVITKNGDTHEFGKTADSRILALGTNLVRVWALNALVDRNGNRVEFTYTTAPGGGQAKGAYYIDTIRYTSRDGVEPARLVQFTYESRPDSIVDFVGGYRVETAFRLKQITVSLSGSVVSTYTLDYRDVSDTGLSTIATITQTGAVLEGAPALPPTTVTWQDAGTRSFDVGPTSILDQHPGTPDVRPMDVTGSGRTDLVQLWIDGSNTIHATSYLATPSDDSVTFVRAADTPLGYFGSKFSIVPVDVDGDGRTDLLVAYASSSNQDELRLAVFLSDGSGAFTDGGTFNTGDTWSSKHIDFFAADANGDGRTDLVEAYGSYDSERGSDVLAFRTYLSQCGDGDGKMFTPAIVTKTGDPATVTAQLAFWPMDVNGDGLIDIVRVWQRGSDQHIIATAYIGVSRSLYDVSFDDQVASDLGTFSLQNQKAFLPVDVNGDGIQDLLQVWQEPTGNGTTLHLSTFFCDGAGGFVAGPDSQFQNQTINLFYPLDLDGTGLTAVVSQWVSGDNKLMFTPFRASPSGVYTMLPAFDAGTVGVQIESALFLPCDANGDGKADLIRAMIDGNQQVAVVPYLSAGAYPDLVSSIENQLGGLVSLQYAPLSDGSVYTAQSSDVYPSAPGQRFPNPMTPTVFPIQQVLGRATYVVSQYTEESAATNRFAYSSTTTVTYEHAQLNLLGRGWQAFGTINRQSDTGRRTVTQYAQDWPFTGMLLATTIEAAGDGTPVIAAISSTEYVSRVSATGVSGTQILEVLRQKTRNEQYESGTFDYALAQTFGYDNYGNESLNVYLGYVDTDDNPLDPAEVVYRYRQYRNDVDSNGWALGYLSYAKESANASDPDVTQFLPGDYHLEHRTYYDGTYNLKSVGKWDDSNNVYLTESYGYDEYGNQTSLTKPGNFTTTITFDPEYHTFATVHTSPADAQGTPLVTSSGYDPRFGVEVAVQDANLNVTVRSLDAFGRVVAVQGPVPAGSTSDANLVTSLVTGTAALQQTFTGATVVSTELTAYLNDGQGGLYTEVQALQSFPTGGSSRDFAWTQTYVDGKSRDRQSVTQTGQSEGNVIVLTDYTAGDHIKTLSVPFFSTTTVSPVAPHSSTFHYDVLGRPTEQRVPAGDDGNDTTLKTWTYSAGGLVTTVSAAGSSAAYTEVSEHHYYNGNDLVRSVTADPAGANATTQFVYDPIARLTSTTDPPTPANPNGVTTTFQWDSLDRKQWLDNPDQNTTGNAGIKAATYAYDATTGMQQSQTDAAQASISYTFDGLQRMLTASFSDGRSVAYTYDQATNGNGQLTRVVVTAPDGSFESQYDYAFDDYGNTNSVTLTIAGQASPFVTTYVFDPQKRVVEETFPDTTSLARTYAFGVLQSQSLDGATAEYPLDAYTSWRRAGQFILGQNAVRSDLSFNPSGQLIDEALTVPAGPLLSFHYGYDNLTQLITVTDRTAAAKNQSFGYTNRRLVEANISGFADTSYAYDNSGNLTLKENALYRYHAHYPLNGSLNGQEIYTATPDACGRTRTRTAGDRTLTFDYDGLGMLRRVTDGGAMVRQMTTDYLGRLIVEADASGNQTVYAGPSYEVRQPVGGAAVVTKYLRDDRGAVASIESDGSTSTVLYYRRDFKGSTTHTFSTDGTLVSELAYSGYGQWIRISGADDPQLKYEQRFWDADLGLYYFNARWYDPATGRFLTPDTTLGANDQYRPDVWNRFAFELNNPINNVDPTGHSASSWIGGLIGVALIIVGVVAIIATGGSATPAVVLAGSILGGAILGAGMNTAFYSFTHTDTDARKFWKGWGAEFGMGLAVGAVTGAIGSGLGSLAGKLAMKIAPVSRIGQFLVRGAVYAVGGAATTSALDTLNQLAGNAIERNVLGNTDVSLSHNLGTAAWTGAAFGAASGVFQGAAEAGFSKLRPGNLAPNESTPIMMKNYVNGEFVADAVAVPDLYTRTKLVVQSGALPRTIMVTGSTIWGISDAITEATGH
ncbi:MAG: VCBS repeat-containing protein [Acidobacteria bacterium]|nr:VCBS repeat-containing protein [Acidobacteriota bacterium]MBV9477650.1 VCBS repeat-containing protein [Acidobacteriota bacterium]